MFLLPTFLVEPVYYYCNYYKPRIGRLDQLKNWQFSVLWFFSFHFAFSLISFFTISLLPPLSLPLPSSHLYPLDLTFFFLFFILYVLSFLSYFFIFYNLYSIYNHKKLIKLYFSLFLSLITSYTKIWLINIYIIIFFLHQY